MSNFIALTTSPIASAIMAITTPTATTQEMIAISFPLLRCRKESAVECVV
jgi:hypothetical protein